MRLSEELTTISSMLVLAREKAEIINLASQINSIIEKTMELEQAKNYGDYSNKKKTLSATIKFTKQEIDKMSKTFKKEFIANGCVGHIIKRPSGKTGVYYEIRYRRNRYNLSVSNTNIHEAKRLFIEATFKLEAPEILNKNKLKFGVILDEWLKYRKGKVIPHTWNNQVSRARRFIPCELREKQIKDIRASDIDNIMCTFTERTYEEMRTIFNGVFKYAKASGIILHNPIEMIPFKRAERINREALNEAQIKNFFMRLKEPQYECIRQVAYVLYFFGLRPCEIDKELKFENGFLICRNRKRKRGKIEYKKIPVPEQARIYIDFSKPVEFPYRYSKCAEIIKAVIGDGLTPYNLRHTFSTICSQYVRPDIVELWMGDSPEKLVEKTYVHFPDDFLIKQMKEVIFIIE